MGESFVPINGFYRILCSGQARFQGRPADAVIGMRGTIGPVMGYDDLKSNFPGHAMTGAKSGATATGKAGRGRRSGTLPGAWPCKPGRHGCRSGRQVSNARRLNWTGFIRRGAGFMMTPVLAACLATVATAAELPPAGVLKERMGVAAETVPVYEPHLSTGDRRVVVEYVGYPVVEVMARLFGDDWQIRGEALEYRALDGYVSRIPVGRFLKVNAWLVFARADGTPFTVDNIRQNQADVPLGPYYLVWDNISRPALLAEGARNWPYQVKEVNLVTLSEGALLPEGLDPQFHEGAGLAREHCLNCHRVNGFGGDKFEADLAALTKRYSRDSFLRVVLTPASERPGATMPAISERLPDTERLRIAGEIFDYLKAVPVQQ